MVLIFHGFANCPEQFGVIAQTLYDQGYNVLLARLPHHGLSDRVTEAPLATKAEDIAASASQMVDIAAGLGDEITTVGFSGGGTIATWVAQNRPDVARVVAISPMFGVQAFPASLTRPVSTAVRDHPELVGLV
ncbi:MAG: alpha/beta fold hydrolase [Anaerolineales bacterium]|nr:alpha/beta fold hydrolase [Anaerolineales bacterium]